MRRHARQNYSLRDLQSLLGVSRRVLSGLIEAGFVRPARGRRNELRFSFRDVVLLRTAFNLQSAKIPSRRILQALARIKDEVPEDAPLTGIRITAVGDTVAVRSGAAQWDATSGQLLLDFEVADVKGDVTFMDTAPASRKALEKQAEDWYALAEQLQETDAVSAEQAYRKAIDLSPEPHFHAYNNLGALLAGDERRCEHALEVFQQALLHFADAELLHFNYAVMLEQAERLEEAAASYARCVEINSKNDEAAFNHAVLLERLGRLEEATQAYIRCLEINPGHEEALRQLTRLNELKGDSQAVIRHLSAWRRSNA
jgi:tetratricopeptide (TPR) repeat protein